jgi:hypothetical protein
MTMSNGALGCEPLDCEPLDCGNAGWQTTDEKAIDKTSGASRGIATSGQVLDFQSSHAQMIPFEHFGGFAPGRQNRHESLRIAEIVAGFESGPDFPRRSVNPQSEPLRLQSIQRRWDVSRKRHPRRIAGDASPVTCCSHPSSYFEAVRERKQKVLCGNQASPERRL